MIRAIGAIALLVVLALFSLFSWWQYQGAKKSERETEATLITTQAILEFEKKWECYQRTGICQSSS